MSEDESPVVASLRKRSPTPYSSIALSPSRQHAVVAAKDTLTVLSVSPKGLSEIRSLRVSQQFQAPATTDDSNRGSKNMMDIRDTFGYPKQSQSPQILTNANVTITDVVWSPLLTVEGSDFEWSDESFLAAAGSNGVFCIWNSRHVFVKETSASTMPPDAVKSHSSRAVNRLAWHPAGKTQLLTASQDGTVNLWERKYTGTSSAGEDRLHSRGRTSWFGKRSDWSQSHPLNPSNQSFSWECTKTFSPKSEAIRDVRWSPFHDNIFALVTDSGHLIVYNINHPEKQWEKIAAHGAGASTLDWHPTRPYVIATGGIAESVKIWDLEKKDDTYKAQNSNTGSSTHSERSMLTDTSSEGKSARDTRQFDVLPTGVLSSTGSFGRGVSLGAGTSVHGRGRVAPIHLLSVSAAVTRLTWRPPVFPRSRDDPGLAMSDPHDGQLAISTASVKGRAGGSGVVSLWSHHRPFMALSVVDGHKEGAVTDFVWLDTPRDDTQSNTPARSQLTKNVVSGVSMHSQRSESRARVGIEGVGASSSMHPLGARRPQNDGGDGTPRLDDDEAFEVDVRLAGNIWQHVLSVGRDGRCLLQSFARGDRPISRVPPSCFAMANLSPFQRGCGSLQVFSVHQKVPSGPSNDFALTGLRRDVVTASARGVFAEPDLTTTEEETVVAADISGTRHPATPPQLVFNVVDQGDLDGDGEPIESRSSAICIAPEVVHLSRFADWYRFYPHDRCPTRVLLCRYNASVAERLRCSSLSRMWRMLASLLQGSGQDELPHNDSSPRNAMQYALLRALPSLLEERANAGDVQTCVAVCEVLQVIPVGSNERTLSTQVPGLELSLVREWYLSYVGLLHQMCLFSHASYLIGQCNDASIGELNKKSTTIDEACPHCGKPVLGSSSDSFSPRRVCRSCRKRIGFCFLCHEPVTGVYVWCPGCGHGGHLDHALEWFGGSGGRPVREVCPTGCGHRCNLAQQLRAFPRTESSLLCEPVAD